MSEFQSKPVVIDAGTDKIFEFLSSFNNFEKLMPEQVINWQSTNDSCSFTIQGMADLAMRMDRKEPPSLIAYASDNPSPFPFQLMFDLAPVDANSCSVTATFKANLNPMLKMMASRPLQNFVNILVDKLKELMEKV